MLSKWYASRNGARRWAARKRRAAKPPPKRKRKLRKDSRLYAVKLAALEKARAKRWPKAEPKPPPAPIDLALMSELKALRSENARLKAATRAIARGAVPVGGGA